MSGDYQTRLDEFVRGKTLIRLSRPVRNRADAWCDACDSLEPRVLYGLKDKETNHYFFVGGHCLRELTRRGAVLRGFCRESSQVAFEQERARRSEENHVAVTAQPMKQLSHHITAGEPDSSIAHLEPKVHLWETAESYVALVQMSHNGAWVWGSAEAPRFEDVWLGHGKGEVLMQRVQRERCRAMAECVTAASEDALMKLKQTKEVQSCTPVGSGDSRPDWTTFWKAVRELELNRDKVLELIDGSTPREWLGKHPENSLEDLLELIRGKHERELADSTAGDTTANPPS